MQQYVIRKNAPTIGNIRHHHFPLRVQNNHRLQISCKYIGLHRSGRVRGRYRPHGTSGTQVQYRRVHVHCTGVYTSPQSVTKRTRPALRPGGAQLHRRRSRSRQSVCEHMCRSQPRLIANIRASRGASGQNHVSQNRLQADLPQGGTRLHWRPTPRPGPAQPSPAQPSRAEPTRSPASDKHH